MDRRAVDDSLEDAARAFLQGLPPEHKELALAEIAMVRGYMRSAHTSGQLINFVAGNWLSQVKVLAGLAQDELRAGTHKTGTMSNTQSALIATLIFALAICDEFPTATAQTSQQQPN